MKKPANFFHKVREFLKPRVPLGCKIAYWTALLALILHLTAIISPKCADFYNYTISAGVRFLLAKLTMWIPFSFAEFIILSIPLWVTLLIIFSYRVIHTEKPYVYARYVSFLLAIITSIYSVFVLTLGTGYRAPTLDEKMGLTDKAVSADELYKTAEILVGMANEELDRVDFPSAGASVMPYSLDEMNDLLQTAALKAAKKYDFISPLKSKLKYVILSDAMSYTHVTGVYTFFTGEANINISFPDYTIPFTAAHELAHQRGIAREDEANFAAFLISMESDDPYIRYSAAVSMYEYVANALYEADSGKYAALLSTLDPRMRCEMVAYNLFFEKYEQSVASQVSEVINDTYLHVQGQEAGTASYGLVVDLAVAYLLHAE